MKKLRILIEVIKSFFPRRLPTGMPSFDAWVADIITVSGLPDNNSTRRTAAEFIFKVRPEIGYMPLRVVSNMLIKAAANQVAQEILAKGKEQTNEPQPKISSS
jgi:hypothetical protein